MTECALSTIDNPYSPFSQWDEWYDYDLFHHHNCCGLLARMVKSSVELSDLEDEEITEAAIDEIVNTDIRGIYIKVTPDYYKDVGKT